MLLRVWTRTLALAPIAIASLAHADNVDCDALPPCATPYAPVCDSHSTTHFSECHFRTAHCQDPTLELIASGVCCPIACPLELAPVCGSDGETYMSSCELLRARCDGPKTSLRIAKQGPCGVDCSAMNCTGFPLRPQCGSDSYTYANDCELQRAQCISGDREHPSFSYDGPCIDTPPPLAPTSAIPVDTGNSGMLAFVPQGFDDPSNQTEPVKTAECPGPSFQICATDGVTYENVCAFVAARRANPCVRFARLGCCFAADTDASSSSSTIGDDEGEPMDQCAFTCPVPEVYEPVCTATTGVVFPNKCAYVSALCRDLLLPPAHPDFCDPLVLPTTSLSATIP